jgi:hypothetical protein
MTNPVREVSVIVPVAERPEALDALYEEYASALRDSGFRFEFLFVFEPYYSSLLPSVTRLRDRGEPVRALDLRHAAGETTLLRIGAEFASFDILVTLPAYPRIEASSLPAVIQPVLDGASMAVARRSPRRDSWLNQLQNRAFHAMVQSAGGQELRDLACGVRAVSKESFLSLPLYGTFHRFLPLLARRAGHEVVEVDAPQHPGDLQPKVYSPRIYARRILDVFGLYFLLRFNEKPLRFFGQVGVLSVFVGVLILIVLVVQRFFGEPMFDRPLLLFGGLLIMLGVQAVALGLVGEMIVHLHAPQRRSYRLKDDQSPIGDSKSSPDA